MLDVAAIMQLLHDFPILYEDADLLVIDKPSGVVVNRAESVKGATVADWMDEKFHIAQYAPVVGNEDFISRSGVVHRLDKETSGCLILAKNPVAFEKLQVAFKERAVKKTYIALVHGNVPEQGEINAPVDRLPWNRERFGIVPGGKESVTKYKVIHRYHQTSKKKQENLSLVEVYPESGRTHQIRVHFKYLGYPIVGDYLYAGRKTQRADRLWCPRVFLHAGKIVFPHPINQNSVEVVSPLSKDLQEIIEKLSS